MSDEEMAVETENGVDDDMDVETQQQQGAQITPWTEFEETGFAKGHYTYTLPHFSKYLEQREGPRTCRVTSDEFEIAGYSWNLLIFPYGNQEPCENISVFLAASEAKFLPPQILPKANFKLILVNRRNPEKSVTKESEHTFTAKEEDWGFSKFADRASLVEQKDDFMPDGELHFRVEIEVQIEEKYTGATRKHTGYVGLKNQGATCYMNSLLQTLYHVPQFREAVYSMPTEEGEDPNSSISLALKYLFFRLQHSHTPVSTKELVASFGWTNMEMFQQHDVEELELKLCEKLEEKMTGTIVDKQVDRLLKGKLYSYIDCINVEYKSTRSEEFLDIQLDVMGCKTVHDSFERLIEVETMEGDNKYSAEGHGLQDARKGVLLEALPPVLQLHLKRFDYDRTNWTPIKVNSRYEFPSQLDLSPYMAPTADKTIEQKYTLHSVLVHSGATHGGHYYAYIRPDGEKWFKFDDELVSPASQDEAVAQQFGADPVSQFDTHSKRSSLNNAYMLVYIRDAQIDRVMQPVSTEELEPHVRGLLEKQLKEKEARRKAKMQAHRFVTIKIITDDHIKQHVDKETFELVNVEEVPESHVLKVEKTETWASVSSTVAQITGIAAEEQEYLMFSSRQNSTVRPIDVFQPTIPDKEGKSRALEPVKMFHRAALKDKDRIPMAHQTQRQRAHYNRGHYRTMLTTAKPLEFYVHQNATGKDAAASVITVFIKWYEVADATLEYVKAVTVPLTATLAKIGRHIQKRHRPGLENAPLRCFEEVRSDNLMVNERQIEQPLSGSHKWDSMDGDIYIFQVADPPSDVKPRFADAEEFLKHLHSLRRITFAPLPGQQGSARDAAARDAAADGAGPNVPSRSPSPAQLPTVQVEVSKQAKYHEALMALAEKINVPAEYVRVTQKSQHNGLPQRRPVRSGVDFVEMTCLAPGVNYEIFYEVLDMPLVDMEQLTSTRVKLLKTNTELVMWLTVRLPQKASISELLDAVRRQAPANFGQGSSLRAVKCFRHRAYDVLGLDATLDPATLDPNYWEIRVEPVPDDDQQAIAAHQGAAAPGNDDVDNDDDDAGPPLVFISHSAVVPAQSSNATTSGGSQALGNGASGQGQLEDYGDPVVCQLAPGETLGSVQARIQARLKVEQEEFSRWKWAIRPSQHSAPIDLSDPSSVLFDELKAAHDMPGQKPLHPPYVIMVHDHKGFAARRPATYYVRNEAAISLS